MGAAVSRTNKDTIHTDPQLLFQRLVAVWEQYSNPSDLFQYELCSYQPALFDESGLSRVANKAQLTDAIWKDTSTVQTQPPMQTLHNL